MCDGGSNYYCSPSDRPRKLDVLVLCAHQQDTTGTRDAPHRIFITNSKLEQSANLKKSSFHFTSIQSQQQQQPAWSAVMEMVRPPPAGFKKCSAFDVGRRLPIECRLRSDQKNYNNPLNPKYPRSCWSVGGIFSLDNLQKVIAACDVPALLCAHVYPRRGSRSNFLNGNRPSNDDGEAMHPRDLRLSLGSGFPSK